MKKKPYLAAILCILLPSSGGYFYLGQNYKAITFFLIMIFSLLTPFRIILFPFVLFAISDSFVLAKRMSLTGKKLKRWEWFGNNNLPKQKSTYKFVCFHNKNRCQENIGSDIRTITNETKKEVCREINITNEWKASYSISRGTGKTTTNTKSIAMRDGVNRIHTVEEFLQTEYSLEKGKTTIYADKIKVTVNPNIEMKVEIIWYNILDTGSLILRDSLNNELIIPYSVVVGIGFDTKYSETHI